MSMEFDVYSCSKCNFCSSSFVIWGRFSYETDSGLLELMRALGWCHACNNLAAVEIIPDDSFISKLEGEIDHMESLVTKYIEEAYQNRGLFGKLLGLQPKKSRHLIVTQNNLMYKRASLEETISLVQILKGRKSKPRCLNCGSEHIEYFPSHDGPDGDFFNPGPAKPIDFYHPGCGGQFTVECSDVRISMIMDHRVYDKEGRLIRKEG